MLFLHTKEVGELLYGKWGFADEGIVFVGEVLNLLIGMTEKFCAFLFILKSAHLNMKVKLTHTHTHTHTRTRTPCACCLCVCKIGVV